MRGQLAAYLLAASLLAACSHVETAGPTATTSAATATPAAAVPVPSTIRPPPALSPSPSAAAASATGSGCQIRGALPDPVCTPGVIDPAVTQANIAQTICVSGYTATVRPPSSYTDALKAEQMRAYGFGGAATNYEEDHLIPLELGGAPRDPKNLWPQPRGGNPNAAAKDALENTLHSLVCAGRVPLAIAQQAIATDWVAASTTSFGTFAVPSAAPTPSPLPAPPATAVPTQTAAPVIVAPTVAPVAAPPPAATQEPPAPVALTVTITASDWGSLAAVTLSGATCTARARYANGNFSIAQGITATKVADAGGAVSWTYTRTATTTKGTGTHFVTCQLSGQTASASATFLVQ